MLDSDQLPRVLVLCDEPINPIGGGGVTMRNLFRGWPKEALAQVWAHHRFSLDTEVCSISLHLGEHRMPGDSFVPKTVRQQQALVKWARAILRPGIRLPYARVRAWAQEFRPQVIYSQATPYPMYTWWLPRWLSRDLKAPLVNHIMDDWPVAVKKEWPPIYRQIMVPILRRQLAALFGSASYNLAISDEMAAAFAKRYETSFIPFHNVIDRADWSTPKDNYARSGTEFRVVYLGALAHNLQLHSLVDIAQAISLIAAQGPAINLTVYGGEIYRDVYDHHLGALAAVRFAGPVARPDLCNCLASADLLVLPVNFDPESLAFSQYSMPTKVPEYMASGAPILVYGPAHVPPVRYARDAGWGYVVERRDQALLRGAIEALMASQETRAALGRRARQLALAAHDADSVCTRFRQVLTAAAQPGPT